MKISKISVSVSLAISLLSGCASQQVPETSAQREERLNSTFHSFDDNRVAFVSTNTDERISAWHIATDPKKIVTIVFNGNRHNLKEINSITFLPIAKSYKFPYGMQVIFKLKDGQNIIAPSARWEICDSAKVCSAPSGAKDFMQAYQHDDLFEDYREFLANRTTGWGGLTHRSPFLEQQMKDSSALPVLGEYTGTLIILNENKFSKLENDINNHEIRKKAVIAQIKNLKEREYSAEAEAEKARIQEAEMVRRTVHVGTKTNCGLVYEIRGPLVGVQTKIGFQYIERNRIYGPSSGCYFKDGQYVGDRSQ